MILKKNTQNELVTHFNKPVFNASFDILWICVRATKSKVTQLENYQLSSLHQALMC